MLRRLEPAVARGVQQRRHAAGNQIARPAIGQAAADDADAVAEAGHRVRQDPRRRRARFASCALTSRAALEQQLDDVGMVLADGHHQRGLLERRIASRRRRRRDRAAAATASTLPTRAAVISAVSPVGSAALASAPASSSRRDHRRVAVRARERQRRDAVAVRRFGRRRRRGSAAARSRGRRREPASAARACRRAPGALTSTF